MGVILDVADGITVGDSACIEGSVISTRPPTAAFLGHEVKSRWPWSLSTSCCSTSQHGVEFCLGESKGVGRNAAEAAGYRWAGCSPDVMCSVVLNLSVGPAGLVSSGNSTRKFSIVPSVAMVFTLGTDHGAVMPGLDSDVNLSRRQLFLQSKRRP
jgi:hypothetical protein